MKKIIIMAALLLAGIAMLSSNLPRTAVGVITTDTSFTYKGHDFEVRLNEDRSVNSFLSMDGRIVTAEDNMKISACIQSFMKDCKKRILCLCECFDCDPTHALPSVGCLAMFAWACLWGETPD